MKATNYLQLFYFTALVRISVCCMIQWPEHMAAKASCINSPINKSISFGVNKKNVLDAKRKNWKPVGGVWRDTPYPGAVNYTQYAVGSLGFSPLPNAEPLKPELGPVVNDVTSFRYPISIPSCREVNGRRNIFIAVISSAKNFEQRAIIRATWAKNLNNAWNRTLTGFAGFAFVLGLAPNEPTQKRIEGENKTHKDIIQIDMPDVSWNLTIKIAGLLNWWHKKCANFKGFLLKVDEYVYLNVRTLEYFIHSNDPFSPTMIGSIIRRVPARGMKLIS